MLAIGKMDQSVTLQSRSVVADAMGQDTITWTTVATVWAEVVPVRGAEFFAAAQTQASQTLKFRIWFREDVDATWRLIWQSRNHDIIAVMPFGRSRERLELYATEGVKDGR